MAVIVTVNRHTTQVAHELSYDDIVGLAVHGRMPVPLPKVSWWISGANETGSPRWGGVLVRGQHIRTLVGMNFLVTLAGQGK